jgi:hypothetical protein
MISNFKPQQITNVSPDKPYIPPEYKGTLPPPNVLEQAELRSALITMIRKICRLSKLTDISGDLLNDTVNDWLEILDNELKAADILPAYALAMRIRTSSFPLQPYELLNAHKQIVAARPVISTGDCSYCRNKGVVTVFDPTLKTDKTIPCYGATHRGNNV